MKSAIFFISGKNYAEGRNLEPGDEPAFSLLEVNELLSSFFQVDGIEVAHGPFRVFKTLLPVFNQDLVAFLRRSVTIHYAGTLDLEFISKSNDLRGSVNEFTNTLKDSEELHSTIENWKKKRDSFWIDRVFHTMKISPAVDRQIKTQLGSLIEKRHRMRVDPETPGLKISIFISQTLKSPSKISFIVSLEGKHHSTKGYNARKASNRPAFKIGTMNPPLTSFLVNFSHPPRDYKRYVLDPFCGTGGILIEALVRGIPVIGMDVEEACVDGCAKNLRNFNGSKNTGFHVIKSSIFHPPLREELPDHDAIDIICTDPPYGNVESLRQIPFKDYIASLFKFLGGFKILTFACPNHYHSEVLPMVREMGGFTLSTIDYFEHKSLSRRIYMICQ